MSVFDSEPLRESIAAILETVARDGLPAPRDLDVALDAIIAEIKLAGATGDDQVKHMVDRFLQWKLPVNFAPDGGVSFEPLGNKGTSHEYRREPVGTNLLDATQAEAMVRHMIEGLPANPSQGDRDEG